MNNKEWDYNTFLAFVLIYASHADLEFSEEEEEQIKTIIPAHEFDELHAYFNTLTDYQALDLILSYKEKYFSSTEEKEHLLIEMKKLFDADGEYSTLEKEMIMFLERVM